MKILFAAILSTDVVEFEQKYTFEIFSALNIFAQIPLM